MTLLELAERCEAATGPDRGLDNEIARQLDLYPRGSLIQPPFTTSIDTALSLVPDGASFDLRTAQTAPDALAMVHPPRMRPTVTARGRTPALALCAASLRARANPEEKPNDLRP